MRCHPIVLLAGLLTVIRAQGQCVARHPSSSFILTLRFPLWRNYVLLCVLPISALLFLHFGGISAYGSSISEIAVSSFAKIAETTLRRVSRSRINMSLSRETLYS